jgi:integrase
MGVYRRAGARCQNCGKRLFKEVRKSSTKSARLTCGCGASVKAPVSADWHLEFWADGKRVREKFGPSRRDAERALAARQTAVREGRFWETRDRCEVTLVEFSGEFEVWSRQHKRSWRRDRVSMRNLCASHLARKRLDEIAPADVEVYQRSRVSGELTFGGKVPSPATVNREVRALTRALNLAAERGLLKSNPIARGVRMLKEPSGRSAYLDPEQINRLLSECADHLRPIVQLALATGMRRGEILGLEWSEVDLARGVIRLPGERTKNGRPRAVPINNVAREVLREAVRDRVDGLDLVFHKEDGTPLGDPKKAFAGACRRAHAAHVRERKEAGLRPTPSGFEDLRFHDLRHTFASGLAQRGVPLQAIGELLGHRTPSMVSRYAHLSPEFLKGAVDEASAYMLGGHRADPAHLPKPAADGEQVQPDRHTSATRAAGGKVISLEKYRSM